MRNTQHSPPLRYPAKPAYRPKRREYRLQTGLGDTLMRLMKRTDKIGYSQILNRALKSSILKLLRHWSALSYESFDEHKQSKRLFTAVTFTRRRYEFPLLFSPYTLRQVICPALNTRTLVQPTVPSLWHAAAKRIDFFYSSLCHSAKVSHGFTPCASGFYQFVVYAWQTLSRPYKCRDKQVTSL